MKKLFYKLLLWLCVTSYKRTEYLYDKNAKKMNDCLEVIAALMEKAMEIEEAYKADINLSVACLPDSLDALKEIVKLSADIKQGNGFMTRMEKCVEINEENHKKLMDMIGAGTRVSEMKHDLELAMQATFHWYFVSQSRAVNLKHMNVILHNKIEKFTKLCKE